MVKGVPQKSFYIVYETIDNEICTLSVLRAFLVWKLTGAEHKEYNQTFPSLLVS